MPEFFTQEVDWSEIESQDIGPPSDDAYQVFPCPPVRLPVIHNSILF